MTLVKMRLNRPGVVDMLGFIPQFLDIDDPRSAIEQLDANYQHGGGWRPMDGWKWRPVNATIEYPGDEPLAAIAEIPFRDEVVYVFEHAWVLVVKADGNFQIARMD